MAPAKTPRRSASTHLSLISHNTVSPRDAQQVLMAAFTADDYFECIENLEGQGIHPRAYIDGLDRLIDTFEPGSEIFHRSLRALRKTCGIYGLLPTSHQVSEPLTLITPGRMRRPFASGGHSDVWKASNYGGRIFAVKQLRTYEVDDLLHVRKKFCKCVIICRRIGHENIMSVEGVAPVLFELSLVSKWMDNGNVLQYAKAHPQVDRVHLLLGITRGLGYLHSNEVIHGDLKGPNILIDQKGNPLLADFGLSSITKGMFSVNVSTPHYGGTIRWSAPELLAGFSDGRNEQIPTKKSDVYSLSMVIVELYTGNIPFANALDPVVILKVTKGERPPKPASAEVFGMTPALWKLTQRCWHQKPVKRPDVPEVLEHIENRKISPQQIKRLRGFFTR